MQLELVFENNFRNLLISQIQVNQAISLKLCSHFIIKQDDGTFAAALKTENSGPDNHKWKLITGCLLIKLRRDPSMSSES